MPNTSSALFVIAISLLSTAVVAQRPSTAGLLRCGTALAPNPIGVGIDNPDCDYNNTNPSSQYAPTSLLRIPVVVHVIQTTGGTGNLSNSLVQSQITVLNEDFRAMAGTPGQNGVDSQIEFFLATEDPNGLPTSGILRYTNNTWFNDIGNYWSSTAWDTSRYLNIYTNTASGSLGYVPDLPQGGSVLGTSADRVVCYYATFGRPGLAGPPYNTGRTATHEVGHFFGLFHTFQGGCAGGSCYSGGDRICDTANESGPRFGCPTGSSSCGSLDPIRNYMDYTDDTCMQGFTAEQVRRMRCTLQHYRPLLAAPSAPASATARTGAGNFNSAYTVDPPQLGQTITFSVTTSGTGYGSASVRAYASPDNQPFAGQTILVDTASSLFFVLPVQVNASVCTWNVTVPNNPAIAGLPLATQGVLLGSPPGLTNAMDLVVGN